MKFRVDRDAFEHAVAWSAKPLPTKPTMPILSGLMLDVAAGQLEIAGFDYEVSTRATLPVEASESDQTLVPGRLLAEIVRSLPSAPVTVSTDASRIHIECGSSRFTLPTLPVDEYPTLPDLPEIAGTIATDDFIAAVGAAAIAAGRDDTLPVLTGIRMEIKGDKITLVSTDRYRLAVRELTWKPVRSDIETVALVPARTLLDTARNLTGGSEVELAIDDSTGSEGMIGFSSSDRISTTRLLEGQFPPYATLFPDRFETTCRVEATVLEEAVKRVSLVATKHAPVRLTFGDGQIVLEAGSGDDALASEAIEAEYEGEELTVAFSPGFLLDGLGAIGSQTAQFSFNGSIKPSMLTGPETAEVFRYLLMPIRLAE